MKALLQIIDRVREAPDQPWALASLVGTRGSTYRKPGARMLIASDGSYTGVLSGGCLEEEIARHGVAVINGAPSTLLSFDTRRLYGCDGHVRILVERIRPEQAGGHLLMQLGERLDRREHCRLRTSYVGDAIGTRLLEPAELVPESDDAFIHCVPLPVRLLLFGTGPEIAPMRQLAHTLGWIVHQFSHASELASHFKSDSQTAALVMTHHFGRDLAVLDRLLLLGLPYVGLLGPRKRHWQLLKELHARPDFEPAILTALHAPAGLDIGSEAPEEIALSIVSEVSAVLANRHGGHLRERAAAIHLVTDTPAVNIA